MKVLAGLLFLNLIHHTHQVDDDPQALHKFTNKASQRSNNPKSTKNEKIVKKNDNNGPSNRRKPKNKNKPQSPPPLTTAPNPTLSTANNHTCFCNSDTSNSAKSFFGRNNNNPSTGLVYLVNAHDDRTLHDASKLIDAISHPKNLIFVHIDKKYPRQFWEQSELYKMITECPPCGIRIISSERTSDWGKWNMNDPVLWAIDELAHNPEFKDFVYDKFITLSGDTYPTMSQNYLHYLFSPSGPLNKWNFVTSIWCETGLRPTKYR